MINYIPVAATCTFAGILALASSKDHDLVWYTLLVSVWLSFTLYMMLATNDPKVVLVASWIGIAFGLACMVAAFTSPSVAPTFFVLCVTTVTNTFFYMTHVIRGLDTIFVDDDFIDMEIS